VKDRREIIVFASRKTKKLRNYDAKSAPMDKALVVVHRQPRGCNSFLVSYI
jgi:hypothetical protein